MNGWTRRALHLVLAALVSGAACRRAADVPPEVYRDAVVAFHTALAAIDTSQEVLAREQLDRVVALVPQEPAGWANLGLLLLRQQENAAAKERLECYRYFEAVGLPADGGSVAPATTVSAPKAATKRAPSRTPAVKRPTKPADRPPEI